VEKRLAEWTLLPVHYGEGLQVLRYKKTQKYDAVGCLALTACVGSRLPLVPGRDGLQCRARGPGLLWRLRWARCGTWVLHWP
jgi:hypothetical protein